MSIRDFAISQYPEAVRCLETYTVDKLAHVCIFSISIWVGWVIAYLLTRRYGTDSVTPRKLIFIYSFYSVINMLIMGIDYPLGIHHCEVYLSYLPTFLAIILHMLLTWPALLIHTIYKN
jgi:hypothetical protein